MAQPTEVRPLALRSTWCDVDMCQFRKNLELMQKAAGTSVLLAVKANAYGHGLLEVSLQASRSDVRMLGVGTAAEAKEIQAAGITTPILVLNSLTPGEIEYCVAHGVHFLVWRLDQLKTALRTAAKFSRRPYLHLEIDTGMSRTGCSVGQFPILLEEMQVNGRRVIAGICSHFHSIDNGDVASAERQLASFLECADLAAACGIGALRHVANSVGMVRLPGSRLDMVRIGSSAYGLVAPDIQEDLPRDLQPILSWKAEITNVTRISRGTGVSYGWNYVAQEDEYLATLSVGYADGFRRYPYGVNRALVRGTRTEVVGNICMNQCILKVPGGIDVHPGLSVTLLGKDGGVSISADDIASSWGTNRFDVVAGISSSVPRRYICNG